MTLRGTLFWTGWALGAGLFTYAVWCLATHDYVAAVARGDYEIPGIPYLVAGLVCFGGGVLVLPKPKRQPHGQARKRT